MKSNELRTLMLAINNFYEEQRKLPDNLFEISKLENWKIKSGDWSKHTDLDQFRYCPGNYDCDKWVVAVDYNKNGSSQIIYINRKYDINLENGENGTVPGPFSEDRQFIKGR